MGRSKGKQVTERIRKRKSLSEAKESIDLDEKSTVSI